MKFNKELLLDLIDCSVGQSEDNLHLIQNEIINKSRWSIIYEIVFKDTNTGKFYNSCYSRGATECQDERPYQDEGDEVECQEVFPHEVISVIYTAKP